MGKILEDTKKDRWKPKDPDQPYGLIYKATNKINGKIYIGQTTTRLSLRIYGHVNDRHKRYFQYAVEKYGEDGFIWEEIDYADNEKDLIKIEDKYIYLYDSTDRKKGYNILKTGLKHITRTDIFWGRKNALILEFKTKKEAGEQLNISPRSIICVLSGIFKQAKGWIFSYDKEELEFNYTNPIKTIYARKGDDFFEFDMQKEAAEKTGVGVTSICHVLQKMKDSALGWRFSYLKSDLEDDSFIDKYVYFVRKYNFEIMTFNSYEEICERTDISTKSINDLLNKEKEFVKGWRVSHTRSDIENEIPEESFIDKTTIYARKYNGEILSFSSQKEVSENIGASVVLINLVLKKKYKQAKGYRLSYVKSEIEDVVVNGPEIFASKNDGKIISFSSKHEASKVLGVNVYKIASILNKKIETVNGYCFSYSSSDLETMIPEVFAKRRVFFARKDDGDIIYFSSQAEAGKFLNVDRGLVGMVLIKKLQTAAGYRLSYTRSDLDVPLLRENRKKGPKKLAVKTDTPFFARKNDEEILYFSSREQAVNLLKISISMIGKVLNKECKSSQGYRFSYLSSDLENTIILNMRYKGKPFFARKDDSEILSFSTQKEASEFFKVDVSTIGKSLQKKRKIASGWNFSYLRSDLEDSQETVFQPSGDMINNISTSTMELI